MDSLDIQVYRFSVMLLAGFVAGFLLDVYRVFRWLTRPKGLVVYLEDILFWLACTPLLLFALVVSNWIELRLYAFLGTALGLGIYFSLASPLMVALLSWAGDSARQAVVVLTRKTRAWGRATYLTAGRWTRAARSVAVGIARRFAKK